MKVIKVLAGIVLVLVVAALLLTQTKTGRNFLLDLSLPNFPDWPAPVRTLEDGASGTLYFATSSPYDFDVLLNGGADNTPTTGLGYLTLPENANSDEPAPAMILLHGSGGISDGREPDYARLLNENGIAAFVVDYYSPRGVTKQTNYIMKVSAVTEFDVIVDAYAALKLLGTHPAIDANRIGVMGFSYGGMATRFAMDERFRKVLAPEHKGFALHIDVYGPCFQNLNTTATNGSPLLTLRGTEDYSNDLEACVVREQQLRELGVEVEAHVYQGAGHAWEANIERSLKEQSPYIRGCEVQYDERGFSWLNGEAFSHNPPDASRVERVATRLASGGAFQQCLLYGYIIGKDEATQQQANAAMLDFLNRHFALGN